MSIETNPRTGELFGCCDACRKEIKANETGTMEISVSDSPRRLTAHLLHVDCRPNFARLHNLAPSDFWKNFSNPKAFAVFDQLPEGLPKHIAKILRDFQAHVRQSIEAAKDGGAAK